MGRKSRKKHFKEEYVNNDNKFEDLDIDHDEHLSESDDHYGDLLDKIITFKLICEENCWPIMNKSNSVTIMMDYLFKSNSHNETIYYNDSDEE